MTPYPYRCQGGTRPGLPPLDRGRRREAPLGPRAVVDPNALPAQQIGERKPGRARPATDRAIDNQLAVARRIDRQEQLAEFLGATESPVSVLQILHRHIDGRRDAAGPAYRLRAARRPEALAPVLGLGANVHDGCPSLSRRLGVYLVGSH